MPRGRAFGQWQNSGKRSKVGRGKSGPARESGAESMARRQGRTDAGLQDLALTRGLVFDQG